MKLTNPKNGEVIVSPFETHREARESLRLKVELDAFQKPEFAKSILQRMADLTPTQEFWLHKLAMPNPNAPQLVAPRKVDLSGVQLMLETAKASGLKFPSITLTTGKGIEVKINIAGDKSKHKGSIMLSSGSYGNGFYYGRITKGILYAGKDMNAEVEGLLVDLSNDPHGTAQRMGSLTGRCCFCRRSLEQDNSVALGYGATCAKKFGLSHNKGAASAKRRKVERFVIGELDLGNTRSVKRKQED